QQTNAVAGTVVGPKASSTAATIAQDTARNLANNRITATGRSGASTGAAVSSSQEIMVPLSAFARYRPGKTPLAVNHQGLFVASTVSFNLAPGKSLSDAGTAIGGAMTRLGVPGTIHGTFQGTARAFQQSLANEPYLVVAAIAAVYIVLGVLYESYVHP